MAKETVFPAARIDEPFSIATAGSVFQTDFRNPIEKTYRFYVRLIAANPEEAGRLRSIAGDGGIRNGQPANSVNMPVRLGIRRLEKESETVVLDRQFTHYQLGSGGPREDGTGIDLDYLLYRTILPRGTYRIHVVALADIPQLQGVRTAFEMSAPSFLGG